MRMSDGAVVRKFRVGDVVGYLPGKREEAFEYLESLGYEAKDNSESSLIVVSTPSDAQEIVEKMHELESDFPISAEKVIVRFLPEIAHSLAVIADRLKDIDNGREKEVESICDSLDTINHTIFTIG